MFYFAGRCLALDETPEFEKEVIYRCNYDLIDWEEFVFLCSNHLILPAIYFKFVTHNLTSHLPLEVTDHLQKIFEINRQRNYGIVSQIKKITKVLAKNNIHPVFLKGAANLLDNLYTDIGERILGDIDFLVKEEEYLTAASLLKQEGYANVNDTPKHIIVENQKHYPRLVHPDFEAVVEIHRIPVDKPYLKMFNSRIIDEEKKSIKLIPNCWVPSDSHKMIHIFVHSQLCDKGFLYGNISLRNTYDLLLLSNRFSPEKMFSQIKQQSKARAYFSLSWFVLGINKSFCSKTNLAYRFLYYLHILNLKSSLLYHIYRSIIFMVERLFVGYISVLVKAIFLRNERMALRRRLTDPQWYKSHLELYTNFIKR